MLVSFLGFFAVLVFGYAALQFLVRFRRLDAVTEFEPPIWGVERYKPMLRLLSETDSAFVAADKRTLRQLRSDRNRLFRGYLRCLTRDYARLLNGVRMAMVQSATDRPDLARALSTNKRRFAVALCRIEFRLRLHAVGLSTVDVSGLVEAMDGLQTQVGYLLPDSAAVRV